MMKQQGITLLLRKCIYNVICVQSMNVKERDRLVERIEKKSTTWKSVLGESCGRIRHDKYYRCEQCSNYCSQFQPSVLDKDVIKQDLNKFLWVALFIMAGAINNFIRVPTRAFIQTPCHSVYRLQ